VPEAARAEGHATFVTALRRHLRFASTLRIDHAAGLHRSYWVPAGAEATDGLYVHGPAEEYYAVLAILSAESGATIVGENLGTIPRSVNRGLSRHGVLGMRIAQFEMGGDAAETSGDSEGPEASAPDPGEDVLPAPEPRSLAALNTHDTPTFAGHWHGADIPLRVELGLLAPDDAEDERSARERMRRRVIARLRGDGDLDPDAATPDAVLEALLRRLARGPADLVIASLEDLWLESRPQNVPGIAEGYPNWRRKGDRTLEWITKTPGVSSLLRGLARRE